MANGTVSERRANDRRATVIYRTSLERRSQLKALAAEHGVSVQVYLDSIIWNDPLGKDRRSGPQAQQELPLTG